jgi:penicillin G amidase
VKWILRIGLFLLVAVAILIGVAAWIVERQGLEITDDPHGIPTISGPDWEAVVEAQGFAHAAERMFQMDLFRRAAAGRLSEFFGSATIEFDRRHREEDWVSVADRAAETLDEKQKKLLEAYVRGVNRYIEENDGRWGIEYVLLDAKPEKWLVRDSLLVLLNMCDQLAVAAPNEADTEAWRKHLPKEWFDFLFTQEHPWNEPLFGTAKTSSITVPRQKLRSRSVLSSELAFVPEELDTFGASNSWGWCGKTGCFLANDPHLGASVPHLWYAVRLRVSPKQWAVGVSIPGLPGVVLGMNPYLAWAFTNLGEDVDDYLEEEVDGDEYVAELVDGNKVWKPIETRPFQIRVRNGDAIEGVARFTHRGPLAQRRNLDGWYSRQWLPLKPGLLSFSTRMHEATSWEEMNAAIDSMTVPAQSVLVMDRRGNLGYRASGTGVVRRVTGRRPQRALEGEWVGMQPRSTRPRILFSGTTTSTEARFISTANQRIWIDEFGHRWANDLRQHRIREMLSARKDFTRFDMNAMQLDTKSEYHHRLIAWLAAHASVPERWKSWSGVATEDADTFTAAIRIDAMFKKLCLSRVRDQFEVPSELTYSGRMDSAWMLKLLDTPGSLSAFGLDEREVAEKIVDRATREKYESYDVENRWQAQHPFVGRVPVIGDRFTVDEHPQPGWTDLVRVETPKFGASTRLVWDLSDPKNSTWSLPVGQSGHVSSPHYSDFQSDWAAARPMKVFDDDLEWWFAPQ